MTMLAADISSHNTVTSWPALLSSVDVIIPKISEGTGYVWSGASAALAQARAAGKCVGAYHFYGGGAGEAEADYFLAHFAWRPGEVPILDWEPTQPPADPDGVAAAFCQRIHDRLGVAPLAYMSGSTARSQAWTKTRAASCGLWVAQYGANTGQPGTPPAAGSWGAWAGWQYTSLGSRPGLTRPVDLSTFTGDAATWRALGTPGGTVALTPPDIALLLNYPAYDGGPSVSEVLRDLHVWARGDLGRPTDSLSFIAQLIGGVQTTVAALPTAQAAAVCQGNPHAVLAALGSAATAAAATT